MGDLGIFPLVILGELLLFFRNPFTNPSWLLLLMPFLTLQESFNCFSDNTLTGFSMIFTGDGPDNKQSFSGDNLDGVDCCIFLVIDTASVEFLTIFSSLISEALSKSKEQQMTEVSITKEKKCAQQHFKSNLKTFLFLVKSTF